MNRVSDRLLALSESETLAMARKTRELKALGHDVISLSLGEPDFNTPEYIKDAAKLAIDENHSHYTPVGGLPELKSAISHKFKRDNNLEYSAAQIVASTGAKQSIANVVLSLINPGDEVLLPAPYWVSYIEIIKLAGGIPKIVYAGIDQDFKITAKQIADNVTNKTRLMIFSSPCNPTGSVYSFEELQLLSEEIKKHENLLVIADEIYELIRFSGKHASLAAVEGMYERTITVNGLSKGFAMTGWRLGYIGAPEWIAAACDKFQGQITSATCSITQRAAVTALDESPERVQSMVEGFKKRRDLMLKLLREIPGLKVNEPQGAFYFFPDISYFLGKKSENQVINTSIDLSLYLLNSVHLAVVGGEAFGCKNSIRLSYASSEDILIEAVKRLKKGLEALK